jgi:hypothetical protein
MSTGTAVAAGAAGGLLGGWALSNMFGTFFWKPISCVCRRCRQKFPTSTVRVSFTRYVDMALPTKHQMVTTVVATVVAGATEEGEATFLPTSACDACYRGSFRHL